jgi:hypothetical protein
MGPDELFYGSGCQTNADATTIALPGEDGQLTVRAAFARAVRRRLVG